MLTLLTMSAFDQCLVISAS